jgi:cytochrome c553
MQGLVSSRIYKTLTTAIVAGVVGVATAMLIAGAALTFGSQSANAKPAFSQQTGKPCGFCHENPGGGGKLNAQGEKFVANGYKL